MPVLRSTRAVDTRSHAASETLRLGEYFTLYTKNFYELPGAEITLKGAYGSVHVAYA